MVGESGLFTPADIAYVQEAGVKAVSSTNVSHLTWNVTGVNIIMLPFVFVCVCFSYYYFYCPRALFGGEGCDVNFTSSLDWDVSSILFFSPQKKAQKREWKRK